MVKVIELEWETTSITWYCDHPFGEFKIRRLDESYGDRVGKYMAWNQDGELFDSLDDAKDWFQQVFTDLVMECLVPETAHDLEMKLDEMKANSR